MPAAPDDRALVEAFDRYIDTAMDRYGSLLHPVAYDAFIDGLEDDLSVHREELLVGLGLLPPGAASPEPKGGEQRPSGPLPAGLVGAMDRAGLSPDARAQVEDFVRSGEYGDFVKDAYEKINKAAAKMTEFEQHVLMGAQATKCFLASNLRMELFDDRTGCVRSIASYLDLLVACMASSVYGDLIETKNEQAADFVWLSIAYRRVRRTFSEAEEETFALYYRQRLDLEVVAKQRGVSWDVEVADHTAFLRRVARGLEEEAERLGVPQNAFKKPRSHEVQAWLRAVVASEFFEPADEPGASRPS